MLTVIGIHAGMDAAIGKRRGFHFGQIFGRNWNLLHFHQFQILGRFPAQIYSLGKAEDKLLLGRLHHGRLHYGRLHYGRLHHGMLHYGRLHRRGWKGKS